MMADVVFFLTFFPLIGFVVWTAVTAWQRRQRMKLLTDFHTRLLDRLGSVKDFSDFLQTQAGTRFMEMLTAEPAHVDGPSDRILRSLQTGIVLMSLGVGSLWVARYTATDVHDTLVVVGAIALSLGAGFLLSAAAAYRVSLSLGVLRPAKLTGRAE
jgi:hypothetical protein